MPVQLGSLQGVNAEAVRALRALADAVNTLEGRIGMSTTAVVRGVPVEDVAFLRAQIQNLRDRVAALEAAP